MTLTPNYKIVYMKNSTYLPFDLEHPFRMNVFIVMRCFYFQCETDTQRANTRLGFVVFFLKLIGSICLTVSRR